MKIIMMADSHDNLPQLHKAVEWCNNEKVDHVLHAGDLVSPFVNKALKNLNMPMTIVFGNNDGERKGLSSTFKDRIFTPPHIVNLDNRKIAMLHEPDPMEDLQKNERVDLILYGHLHEIDIRKGTPHIVSPGELGGWLTERSTMAVWDTESDAISIIEL